MNIRNAIRECVESVGDPLLNHIIKHCAQYDYTPEMVRLIVHLMVDDGTLRMKEDSIDHDWTYRRGNNWGGTP